ncbi:MAG: FAD-binding oxidoreductase [Bryobacteraceae bacterium]
MANTDVSNWFGDIVAHPKVLVEASSAEEIAAILRNRRKYPSPVRAFGSNHSTAACSAADGGTMIRMRGMNRILAVTADTVRVEAGAILIDVAHELQKQGLQFYVNTEIGNLSIGSAACAGTKDGSMPGEWGQVSSYCIAMKMVLPSGEMLEASEDTDPELMKMLRCSYGTFGVVTEATFRIKPIQPMEVYHETFSVKDFAARLPELWARGCSMMYYMFLFDELVTVEFRKYNPKAKGNPDGHVWPLRNYLWSQAGPRTCFQAERDIPDKTVRYKVVDAFGALWRFKLENLVRSKNTVATDQIIRYPAVSDDSRYTFSLWAFPEETYSKILPQYTRWVKNYYKTEGYRTNMLHVGYRISQDQESLLSYSFDGSVMTIDPVSTANPGWKPFLAAFNEWCSARGGKPLPNQTFGFTHEQAEKALGERLATMSAKRAEFDPEGRLLNSFFAAFFGV